MLLEGRAALVTGGANGIGRAIVERFVEEGARVVIVDRETPELDASVAAIVLDLADTDRLEGTVLDAERAVGPLDILVNCAGFSHQVNALDLSHDDYRSVLAVHLDAPVFLSTIAARGMVARGYGRIVNISSVHGEYGQRKTLAYDIAKAGLNQATRTLAVELADRGVLVNAVAPGFIRTRGSVIEGESVYATDWFNEVYVRHGKLPLRRHGEPGEIAWHVVWLASDRNSYLTGQIVTVDGGLTVTF